MLESEDEDVDHAELHMYGETLMLAGAYADADLSTPDKLGGFHAHVTIYVADVDAHYERAIAAGAGGGAGADADAVWRPPLRRARPRGVSLELPRARGGSVAGGLTVERKLGTIAEDGGAR